MNCIYCKNKTLYILNDGRVKCSKCKKRFSPANIYKAEDIMSLFMQATPINQIFKEKKYAKQTLYSHFMILRKLIALHLDVAFQPHIDTIEEYQEYIYAPMRSKYRFTQSCITFSNNGKVYSLLTDLSKSNDGLKNFSKIRKVKKDSLVIESFWEFFESFISKYRGVSKESFFYYLKEAEFRFNYTKAEQKEILTKLLREHRSNLS